MKSSILETQSGLFCLVDNRAALMAAQRLAEKTETGIRFCCEHREKLSVAEGRKRDEADSARRAKYQQSMADLEQRIAAADQMDESIAAEQNNDEIDELDDDSNDELDDIFDLETSGQPIDENDDFESIEYSQEYDEIFA